MVRAVKEKKSQLIGDTRKDPDYLDLDGSGTFLSELAVPVILNDEVISILNFESKELNKFNEQDQTLLELLAMHVSSALKNIRHYNELDEIHEKHRGELVDHFRRMSSMVRHDLLNPISAINRASEFMKKQPETTQEMLEIIERNIKVARDIMDDWKMQALNEPIVKNQTNINMLINDVVNAAFIPSNIEVSIDVDESINFEVDRNKFLRTLSNLVKNSVEAMPEGGKIAIKATVNDGLVINVSDTGKGMSKSTLEKIFTPFFTTKETGMGLGLAFCKQAVEAHGGEIHVTSTTGKGTIITISIPNNKLEYI